MFLKTYSPFQPSFYIRYKKRTRTRMIKWILGKFLLKSVSSNSSKAENSLQAKAIRTD